MRQPAFERTMFTFDQLQADILEKILLLVVLSGDPQEWFCTLARISKRVKFHVESLLQDPTLLERITFCECGNTLLLDRLQTGLSKIHTLTIAARKTQPKLDLQQARFPQLASQRGML